MLGTIRSALVAATAYLKFRTQSEHDRRIDRSRERLRLIHEELERLRNSDDPYADVRADWLRSDYKAESLHLAYLKSLRPRYPDPRGRDGSTD